MKKACRRANAWWEEVQARFIANGQRHRNSRAALSDIGRRTITTRRGRRRNALLSSFLLASADLCIDGRERCRLRGYRLRRRRNPPPSLRRSGCGRGGPETVIGANRLACTAPCLWPATSRIRRPGSDATRPVRLACKTVHSSASRSVPLGLCALVCGSGSACASGCAPPVGCVSCVGCTFVGCTLGRTPERPAARRTRRWAHVAGVRPSFAGRLCMQTRASAGIRLLKFLFCSLSSCSLYFRCTPLPA